MLFLRVIIWISLNVSLVIIIKTSIFINLDLVTNIQIYSIVVGVKSLPDSRYSLAFLRNDQIGCNTTLATSVLFARN